MPAYTDLPAKTEIISQLSWLFDGSQTFGSGASLRAESCNLVCDIFSLSGKVVALEQETEGEWIKLPLIPKLLLSTTQFGQNCGIVENN